MVSTKAATVGSLSKSMPIFRVAWRTFAAKFRPRKEGANIPASYARALAQLVSAARAFAQRSDESWAAEVAELRDRLATTEAP